jgi:hypothetical protein
MVNILDCAIVELACNSAIIFSSNLCCQFSLPQPFLQRFCSSWRYLPSFSIVKLDDFRIRVVTWSRRVAATFVVIIYLSLFSIAMKQLFRHISSTSICIVYRRSPWFGRPFGIDFKSYRFLRCEIKKILVFPSFAFQVKGIWKSTCFRFLFSIVLGCFSLAKAKGMKTTFQVGNVQIFWYRKHNLNNLEIRFNDWQTVERVALIPIWKQTSCCFPSLVYASDTEFSLCPFSFRFALSMALRRCLSKRFKSKLVVSVSFLLRLFLSDRRLNLWWRYEAQLMLFVYVLVVDFDYSVGQWSFFRSNMPNGYATQIRKKKKMFFKKGKIGKKKF